MITARQSRAARALLGWTQETLADKARVSLTALKRLESENGFDVLKPREMAYGARSNRPGSFFCRQKRERVLLLHQADQPVSALRHQQTVC